MFRSAATIYFALFSLTAVAQTAPASRTWNFDLKDSGTYKVQVQHDIKGIEGIEVGATKVKYSIKLGNQTQSRELDLIANQPYIPLIFDIVDPQKMRVAIAGLPQSALKQTSVYVYDARTVPQGQYFEPPKHGEVTSGSAVKQTIPLQIESLLNLPEERIDVGIAALTFAKEIYPNIDIQAYSRKIDVLADRVRLLAQGTRDPERRIRVLNTVLFRDEKFHYDRDPFSRSKQAYYFLNGILDTKQGICYTMPLLYIAVAQRVAYPIYPVAAPDHMFTRYVDPAFKEQNIEITSGGKYFTDESYIKRFSVSKQGLDSGSYMRAMTYRELLGHMLVANARVFAYSGQGNKALAYLEKAAELNPKFADHYDALRIGYLAISQTVKGRTAEQWKQKARRASLKAKELGFVDPAEIPTEREGLRGAS